MDGGEIGGKGSSSEVVLYLSKVAYDQNFGSNERKKKPTTKALTLQHALEIVLFFESKQRRDSGGLDLSKRRQILRKNTGITY